MLRRYLHITGVLLLPTKVLIFDVGYGEVKLATASTYFNRLEVVSECMLLSHNSFSKNRQLIGSSTPTWYAVRFVWIIWLNGRLLLTCVVLYIYLSLRVQVMVNNFTFTATKALFKQSALLTPPSYSRLTFYTKNTHPSPLTWTLKGTMFAAKRLCWWIQHSRSRSFLPSLLM